MKIQKILDYSMFCSQLFNKSPGALKMRSLIADNVALDNSLNEAIDFYRKKDFEKYLEIKVINSHKLNFLLIWLFNCSFSYFISKFEALIAYSIYFRRL
ncbi:hypothetical protein BpHYR1_004649 [Brachionus plicatilis]|uniref:Uncharacterized protein n=1 Tax=Brachionus plicatilis TaxID=10195 RepID=A0A3M7S7E7_BRAPC|nr:hypothetical protein BpHYR1_004649 [Brachionus plicatilis]